MTDSLTPVLRALVVATLLVATATVMLVTVGRARATGALAVGACGAYGQAFDFSSAEAARESALSKCTGKGCRVVTTISRGCGALAVDYADHCGGHGWGKADELARAQNEALRACYGSGAKDCVIRTFFCDAKG